MEHAQNQYNVTLIRLPFHIASTSTLAEYLSLARTHLQELGFIAQVTEKKEFFVERQLTNAYHITIMAFILQNFPFTILVAQPSQIDMKKMKS